METIKKSFSSMAMTALPPMLQFVSNDPRIDFPQNLQQDDDKFQKEFGSKKGPPSRAALKRRVLNDDEVMEFLQTMYQTQLEHQVELKKVYAQQRTMEQTIRHLQQELDSQKHLVELPPPHR
jgi:hypothetical protein